MTLRNKDFLKEKEKDLQETLTVGELIEILKKYPCSMKVMTTWESTVHELIEDYIYEAYTGTLYIDADEGFYERDFKK